MRQTNRPRLCGGGGEAKRDEILIWCRRLARSPPTWRRRDSCGRRRTCAPPPPPLTHAMQIIESEEGDRKRLSDSLEIVLESISITMMSTSRLLAANSIRIVCTRKVTWECRENGNPVIVSMQQLIFAISPLQ